MVDHEESACSAEELDPCSRNSLTLFSPPQGYWVLALVRPAIIDWHQLSARLSFWQTNDLFWKENQRTIAMAVRIKRQKKKGTNSFFFFCLFILTAMAIVLWFSFQNKSQISLGIEPFTTTDSFLILFLVLTLPRLSLFNGLLVAGKEKVSFVPWSLWAAMAHPETFILPLCWF